MKYLSLTVLLFIPFFSSGQTSDVKDPFEQIGEQIFLPSIEIGYMVNSADALSGGIIIKTSIEYRIQNVNDAFVRINYDTYDSGFTFMPDNGLTDVVKGTAFFSDLLMGLGYRFGDNRFRYFLMVQPGIKFYNFPELVLTNNAINIEQEKKNIFSTRFTIGFEYYITPKSAVSIDLLQSQVWDKRDFWEDSGSAYGFSVGFITSLF